MFVSGSSTVEPISIRVGELADELSDGELQVTVEGPGTGDGFAKFCAGETDISDASRPINDEEAQTCADAGIEYVELEVAIDGLTVATNPANADIECLDVPALYALIGPESEGFANWSDANDLAAEVGSASAPFPDVPLVVYGPGEESGTYDSFVEFAIADLAEERGAEEATRADYTSSANDNLIVQGIESADTSLGWVGYAFFVAEQERMKSMRSTAARDASARHPRRSAMAAIRSAASSTSTSTPARRPRTRPSPRSSTSTSPSRVWPRSPRPATSTCPPIGSRRAWTPGRPCEDTTELRRPATVPPGRSTESGASVKLKQDRRGVTENIDTADETIAREGFPPRAHR